MVLSRSRLGLLLVTSSAALILSVTFLVAGFAHPARPAQLPAPIFVDATATAPGNGLSWTTAYTSLDVALAAAVPGNQIWVAAGTYVPTVPATGFVITKHVYLYGGFAGGPNGESTLAQRAGSFLTTVLDGAAHTCAHVVSISGVPGSSGVPGVVIDGFKITGGDGINHGLVNGGGILSEGSDLDVANCFFVDNWARNGGGIYFTAVSTPPALPPLQTLHVKLCEFTDTTRTSTAGASAHSMCAVTS